MKLYKLTDSKGQTQNQTQWGENVTHNATGDKNQDLCTNGWIHAYESPLLAVLLNPIHANFQNPILWEAEGTPEKRDGQLKCGCRTLTTIKQIPLPVFTTTQKVAFAILCTKTVCTNQEFNVWADNWLSNKDRTRATAEAAAWATAWATAWVAARAAARATAWSAAWSAAEAARSAAWATAWAAAEAARSAAWATAADLHNIALQALNY